MYAIWVTVKVKPDQRERFLTAISDDAICSERDEPGCLRFNVMQDQTDENTYYFLEIYRDEAAFEAHRATPHLARWRQAAAEVCEGPSSAIRTNTVVPAEASYWEKRG
jgi:autoinducer 2-degrading protein